MYRGSLILWGFLMYRVGEYFIKKKFPNIMGLSYVHESPYIMGLSYVLSIMGLSYVQRFPNIMGLSYV